MTKSIIADTGPIVAALDRREPSHVWAAQNFKMLPKPFLTCEAVITEACYLMRPSKNGEKDVLYLLDQGVLTIGFSLTEEVGSIMNLMQKYADVPMSLADACIVRMTELLDGAAVMTFDSDFRIYRRRRNRPIELITSE